MSIKFRDPLAPMLDPPSRARRGERIFLAIIILASIGWSLFCGFVGYLLAGG